MIYEVKKVDKREKNIFSNLEVASLSISSENILLILKTMIKTKKI